VKQKLISASLTVLLVLVALPLLFIVCRRFSPFQRRFAERRADGVPMLFADPQLPMLGGTCGWPAASR
jgi:hypothetical protein